MEKSVIRRIVEFSVKNKSIIILIVAFLVLFGVYALIRMPKQEFPVFSIRQGLVVGVYPGATSEQVEEQLTVPLEEFLFSYKEVQKNMTYSVTSDGMVVIYVQLDAEVVKSDDEFWSKFRHDVAMFKNTVPSGVAAIVTSNDFGSTSALLISIESKEKPTVSWRATCRIWRTGSEPFRRCPICAATVFKTSRLVSISTKRN